ncbi:MAG: magnesium transporter [Firmicutes bacterium]|nr:magnesium transporter [Bacillota bacterium]
MGQKRENQALLETIQNLLAEKKLTEALRLIVGQHPADVAEILSALNEESQALLFRSFDEELAGFVLSESDPGSQAVLLAFLGSAKAASVLREMAADDLVDLLGELPVGSAERLLKLLPPEDAGRVRQLLGYGEDTAGGIMTTELVSIRAGLTVGEAIAELREKAPGAETIYYVYVVDDEDRLVGVVSLRELIIAREDQLISEIMRSNVVSVYIGEDQEEVARIVSKYNFLAVPVVDYKNRLRGIITFDDIMDVIEEEATEDFYRLAGTWETEESAGRPRVLRSLKTRLPWLLVTLVGGIISGRVIRSYSDTLNSVLALAYFMPLIAGMGGNVGTQSSTIVVRGIATGDITPVQAVRYVLSEAQVGLLVGLICGALVGLVAYLWQGLAVLGLIVGVAMMANMLTAATIGALVPLVFRRLGIDPAVASAPFISTGIDITGLSIYFGLTALLLSKLVI